MIKFHWLLHLALFQFTIGKLISVPPTNASFRRRQRHSASQEYNAADQSASLRLQNDLQNIYGSRLRPQKTSRRDLETNSESCFTVSSKYTELRNDWICETTFYYDVQYLLWQIGREDW